MQWQIVIPMSGFGERFRKAGYTVPKPLIQVNGKPMIAHVLDLFPGERCVHFVCNADHLDNPDWDMRGILNRLCPDATIHAIAPHRKGPVHAVAQIADTLLNPDWPVAVNYCDFTGRWDWEGFKRFMARTGCDGAVICYTGFHPHMLTCTRFAYCRTDGSDRVVSIQEKQPYTDTPMQEWASCGTY
ncbi:MAG: NTP transferase domain-containing protein [Desulfovibrionaceae bacterium]|nr:NTP transferase domain-containing protein [Desulfovibrionaceae bacterium]